MLTRTAAWLAGDTNAIETLVRSQTPRLLALARRMLKNEHDAEDAVQEAFLSAVRSAASFEAESHACAWLRRVTLNAALMRIRSRRRRPERPVQDGEHARLTNDQPCVEVLMAQREEHALVQAGIARIPEHYRRVIVMRDIEGLEARQVSQALGVSDNVVKVRLFRARRALRTQLEAGLAGDRMRETAIPRAHTLHSG